MIVSCPSCDSKYQVADDKVAGSVLRTRCKACGSQILVDGTIPPSQKNDNNEDDVTRIMHPEDRLDMEMSQPPSGDQWTVNIGESETRPMTSDEVVQGYANGSLGDDVLVWRSGMANWASVADVPELIAAIEKTGRRPHAAAAVAGSSQPPLPAHASATNAAASAYPRTPSPSGRPSRTSKPPPPVRTAAVGSAAKPLGVQTSPAVSNANRIEDTQSALDPNAPSADFYAKLLSKVGASRPSSLPPAATAEARQSKPPRATWPPPVRSSTAPAATSNFPGGTSTLKKAATAGSVPSELDPGAAPSDFYAKILAKVRPQQAPAPHPEPAQAVGAPAGPAEAVDIPINVDVALDDDAQPSAQAHGPVALVRRASPTPPKRPDPVIPVDIQLPPMDAGNAVNRPAEPTIVLSPSTRPPAPESKARVGVESKSEASAAPAIEVATDNTSPGLRAYRVGRRKRLVGTLVALTTVGLLGIGGGVAATIYARKPPAKHASPPTELSVSAIAANASVTPPPVSATPSAVAMDADELAQSSPSAAGAVATRGSVGKQTPRAGAAESGDSVGDKNKLAKASRTLAPTAPAAPAAPAAPTAKSPAQPFNREAAIAILGIAAARAPSCKRPGAPTGNGRAIVTFDPDGRVVVANIVGDDIAGTPVAKCVAGIFQRVKVAPFSGDRATVSKPFAIPP
jgi:predicted Zn finger-like uncharacterized protein